MAAPAVASVATNTLDEGTSLVIPKPSGLADGDLMVATVDGNLPPTFTPPSGSWIAIGSAVTDGFSAARLHSFWKIADAADAAASDFTFTRSTTGDMAGIIRRIFGYDTSTPINTSAIGSATSGTSQTSPGVTTNVDECLVLRDMGVDASSVTITTAGVTNDANVAVSAIRLASGHETQAVAGATGTETWTFSSSNQMVAKTIAIAPGAGGGTAPPVITSPDTFQIDEGATAVGTVTSSGIPSPAFSISGGANAASYSIGSSTGVLTRTSGIPRGAPEVIDVTVDNDVEPNDTQTISIVPTPIFSGPTPSGALADAEYFYPFPEAHDADNTQYPNHGTRTNRALILGDTYEADGQDPTHGTADSIGHLIYTRAADSYAHTPAPEADIDAESFTVGVRFRLQTINQTQTLFNVIKNIGTDEKTIFLHIQSDNTPEGRVWDGTTEAQVTVIGTTTLSVNTWYDLFLRCDGLAREISLWIAEAGDTLIEEDTQTYTNARRLVGSDYHLEWPVGVGLAEPTLCPDMHARRLLFACRDWDDSEIANIGSNTQWNSEDEGGGGGNRRRRQLICGAAA